MIFAARFFGYEVALWILWAGGNRFVRFLLDAGEVRKTPGSAPGGSAEGANIRAGKYIGPLERIVIVAGLLAGGWQIIAAVIALKTIARYKELDVQITAEYFLVGSFGSIVWALATALALLRYDAYWGFQLFAGLHMQAP